ncbi:protein MIX23-like isoform X3 [Homarus americanus]|uniref:protein MIX23-like isoform X3 n=1 Tax=Homarus americanus TaxID=6706 RepID=UPI001C43F783|nr:protein MIX23-like isoform X3 [Homarus americanus]
MAATTPVSCEDITDTLQAMRAIDDKIIYELNLATPTQSFRNEVNPENHCRTLHERLSKTYEHRGAMIETCLNESRVKVRSLQAEALHKKENPQILRKIRSEQSRIRELQNEVTIEEIIRERSLRVFEERCRQFFKPPKAE